MSKTKGFGEVWIRFIMTDKTLETLSDREIMNYFISELENKMDALVEQLRQNAMEPEPDPEDIEAAVKAADKLPSYKDPPQLRFSVDKDPSDTELN